MGYFCRNSHKLVVEICRGEGGQCSSTSRMPGQQEKLGQRNAGASPDWCGSVHWASLCKPKGHQFDSRSGHMPGSQVRFPVRACIEGNQSMFLLYISVSHSLPSFPSPKINKILKKEMQPWLVWLSGLSRGLRTKGLQVPFPVRAHAWVSGQVPSRGHARGNPTLMFLSLCLSVTLSLKTNK